MKLHEALILKQFGTSVMQDGKRLMSMMADFHAFEDYPAMKKVMGAVFTGRYGKELFTRAADDESGDYMLYIGYLRQSLVQILHFREEFASYAVDSVSFALALSSSVAEPQDHGYEPCSRDKDDLTGASISDQQRPNSTENGQKADGNAEAQRKVSRLHETGLGTEKDLSEALQWCIRAGACGDVEAQRNLGKMYE